MRQLLAITLALFQGACSSLVPERTATRDPGGSVALRALEIAAYKGEKRFPDGFYAASAATMWLGYEGTCVEPGAVFGFHGIKNDLTGIAERIYEAHLQAAHPGLLVWYRGGPKNSRRIVRVTGAWLVAQGWARLCEGGEA